MSKKILLFIIIPFLLLLIIGIIIYIVKHNSHSKSNQKKVMFGLALQTNTTNKQIIDLAKLKGKITCFWNWKSSLTTFELKEQYNWTEDLNIQFLPMLWGCNMSNSSLQSSYNYVMLSNEPDMIGGCVDPKVNPCSDGNTDKSSPATSSGYWIGNGDYGCFTDTNSSISSCTKDSIIKTGDKNTFSYLVSQFIIQCTNLHPNTIVVSPAMSQNATGTCNAYKTTFNNTLPVSPPQGPTNCSDCTCNGWLSLLKAAAQTTESGKNWWNNTLKVISIHAYYKYSHHVKNKILEYMKEFEDDIDKGKQIWLTEVAYVSVNSDDMSEYIKESANFAKTLLYANTNPSSIPSTCDIKIIIDGDLPGLLTTTPFLFNGKTASWFDHGLTCVTWFCVEEWANFTTGCNGVTSTGQNKITSFPFNSDGTTNALYNSLFP